MGCPPGAKCLTSVDGTDCRIREPVPFNKKWYSHKFNGPAVRYEVTVSTYTGYIVWINGPFAAGEWPDARIIKDSFIGHMCQDELFIADSGYAGIDFCVTQGPWGHVVNKQIANIRARHETINRKFKEYKAIGDRSRHSPQQHGLLIRTVANLVQLRLQTSEANWSVEIKVPF